jgi:hypothetical protein
MPKKRAQATAADPPASVGDALKDELRSAQTHAKKAKKSTKAQDGGGDSSAVATMPAASAAAAATWETDESAPFPRGGGSALTPLEYRAVAQSAKEDALFEAAEGVTEGAAGGGGGAGGARAAASAAAGGGELVRAHMLGLKQLVAGVRLLAAVSEAHSDRLLLQLPNRLIGRVSRDEVSDELFAALADGTLSTPPDLRKLFHKGEVLCCSVLPAASRSSSALERGRAAPAVELTLRLSIVQRAPLAASPRLRAGALVWATLRSNEEYGFVMDTSAPAGAFVSSTVSTQPSSSSSPSSASSASSAPARWRPHLFALTSGGLQQPRKPLQLAAVGGAAKPPPPLTQDTAYKFEGLQPGMLVDAQVRSTSNSREREAVPGLSLPLPSFSPSLSHTHGHTYPPSLSSLSVCLSLPPSHPSFTPQPSPLTPHPSPLTPLPHPAAAGLRAPGGRTTPCLLRVFRRDSLHRPPGGR